MVSETVAELIQIFNKQGIKLCIHKDKIRYSPREKLDSDPPLKALLIEHKKAVIQHLTPGSTINGSTIQDTTKTVNIHGTSGSTIQEMEDRGSTIRERSESAEWDQEIDALVKWFIDEGQHLIPVHPFQLTKWIRITKPDGFREALLFQISLGPAWITNRNGKLQEDLQILKTRLASQSNMEAGE